MAAVKIGRKRSQNWKETGDVDRLPSRAEPTSHLSRLDQADVYLEQLQLGKAVTRPNIYSSSSLA